MLERIASATRHAAAAARGVSASDASSSGIRGRGGTPGPDATRGGQQWATRGAREDPAASSSAGTIRGRGVALGTEGADGDCGIAEVSVRPHLGRPGEAQKRARGTEDVGTPSPSQRLAAIRRRVATRAAAVVPGVQAAVSAATGTITDEKQDLQQDAMLAVLDMAMKGMGGDGAQSESSSAVVEAVARRQHDRLPLPGPAEMIAAERQLKTIKYTSSPTAGTHRCTQAEETAVCLEGQPTTRARSSRSHG